MKTIYLVNIEEKRYEEFWVDTPAEVELIESVANAMVDLFHADSFCIKYVEPEFEEVE